MRGINGEIKLGGTSEREFSEKANKIREKLHKGVKDARDKFADIEKTKVEALKKTEDLKRSADQEVTKMEIEIGKSARSTSSTPSSKVSPFSEALRSIFSRTAASICRIRRLKNWM